MAYTHHEDTKMNTGEVISHVCGYYVYYHTSEAVVKEKLDCGWEVSNGHDKYAVLVNIGGKQKVVSVQFFAMRNICNMFILLP